MPTPSPTQSPAHEALFEEAIRDRLLELARTNADAYRSAAPFPHGVFDDFLPEAALRAAVESFPSAEDPRWFRFSNEQENKAALDRVETLAPPLRELCAFLNSRPVLQFLEELTGIQGLLPDPFFYGGGLHELGRGGHLDIHVDFNRLPELNLDRRLNLLIYLNENWEESYGGHLELWNKDMTECVRRVLPVFNRCAIFSTSADSYHGNPQPLTCPEDKPRRSIAIYYYTSGLPESEQVKWRSTQFKKPAPAAPPPSSAQQVKNAIKKITPPILVDAYRALLGKT